MNLQESGEMYLETILILSKEKTQVRSIDICDKLNYSKPSVSRAVSLLKNGGFITVDKSGYITFTEMGLKLAEKIYERHTILTKFLTEKLGVSEEIAAEDACRIEHVISDETLYAIKSFLNLHK